MRGFDCPVDVLTEARRLASQIGGEDLPLTFNPGDLSWDQNLLRIVQDHTNHDTLAEQLENWLVAELEARGLSCEKRSDPPETGPAKRCPECSDHWVARHELSEAAHKVAERLFQRWLARKGIADRRAGRR